MALKYGNSGTDVMVLGILIKHRTVVGHIAVWVGCHRLVL